MRSPTWARRGYRWPPEIALEDAAVWRAVEKRTPRLKLVYAIGRFFGVQLGHAPVAEVLPATHRVGEVHLPAVAIIHVGHRGGYAALGHHRVRLAEKRLAHKPDAEAGRGRFDGGTQSGATRADHEDIVFHRLVVTGH